VEIGKKLGGRYKIIRHIGSGGMANVYLGQDLILDRPVAIKVLRFDFRDNKDALRRFQREALSATQLIHPNIVGVYDVDEEDGLQYIVMEFIDGTDLKKYIERQGQVAPDKAIHIMHQVLSAVALAHKNRIIHRDIKPQNILIDNQDRIKITDFGIAVALSETSITQTNTLLGSVHYLSPEQARGSMATSKSDIYALGVVLYELLSGSVPFDGESAVSIALKHFQEPMPSIRALHPEFPQSLENVILKATTKEPADRYQTCEEMMADLDSCLDPARAAEDIFTPVSMLSATKVLTPISTGNRDKEDSGKTIISKDPLVTEKANPASEQAVEMDTGKKKKEKKWKKWLPFLTVFLLLAGAGIVYSFFYSAEPDTISVPDVSNMDQATALKVLTDAGLALGDISEEYSKDVAENLVIETHPKKGSSVVKDAKVDLVISLGEELYTVKDYAGETYESVMGELRSRGFIVERTQAFSSDVPEGSIISQSIEAGTEVKPSETTISFVVSEGTQSYLMRDLSGYTQKSVQDYASEYGLALSVTEAFSADVASGLVMSQSIASGSSFVYGAKLSIVLSKGPKEPAVITFAKSLTIPYKANSSVVESSSSAGSSASSSSDAQSSETVRTNHIVIYIQDEDHPLTDIFREFNISSDEVVTLNFRILEGKTASYRVERDGEIILEEAGLTK
jgi:eukaryotic-like serine/threonine-protein kinase